MYFPWSCTNHNLLPGYGNTVIVDHGKGFYSIYSHLAQIYVYKNATVRQNQIIGKVGDSGYLGPVSLRFGIYGSKKPTIRLAGLNKIDKRSFKT